MVFFLDDDIEAINKDLYDRNDPFDINWPEKKPGLLESACILSQLNCGEIMNKKAIEHLRFIYDRLASHYGEDENSDFMIKFGEILNYENDQLISPVVRNNKKSSEISRDNEIKMQMAKDIYCHMLNSWDGQELDHDTVVKNTDAACNTAEFIFNRFNK